MIEAFFQSTNCLAQKSFSWYFVAFCLVIKDGQIVKTWTFTQNLHSAEGIELNCLLDYTQAKFMKFQPGISYQLFCRKWGDSCVTGRYSINEKVMRGKIPI